MCTGRLTLKARTRTAVKVNYGSERELTLTLNSCFNFSRARYYLSIWIQDLAIHTLRTKRYDMVQPPGFSKKSPNINPFWGRASAEPPLEWTKWAAILEMAVFA